MPRYALAVCLALVSVGAQSVPGDEPRYVNGTDLVRPDNYREWVFLSAGMDMSYGPNAQHDGHLPPFTNIYVSPRAYRSFMQTGQWPDRSVFILEARDGRNEGLINKSRRFQGALSALEANVKDARIPGGWGFFNFGGPADLKASAPPLPERVGCLECHTKHAAVEKTFVQFYPTLLEVARRKGTINKDYDPSHEF